MEYDRRVTAVVFLALVGLGTAGTMATPMESGTVLMMVVPSMLVFGAIVLVLGVKHGEYRARQS
ncbi:MAG: hypothetical protein V5A18_00135 [Haloarculaceae archaeon]